MMSTKKSGNHNFNRREFLGAMVVTSSATGIASAVQAFDKKEMWQPDRADVVTPVRGDKYIFFTDDEAALMEKLVDCIIPPDELGPGAHQMGVTFFLDRQLAGDYGHAYSWYMQGPWPEGLPSQGYQTRLTPAMLYRSAIAAIDKYCVNTYKNKFSTLSISEQNDVVSALENQQVDLDGVPRKTFFDRLLQNVTEGYFSDPIYGGNRNMTAWKMIGFPGARYNYRAYVTKHGEKISLAPVGIMGGPSWKAKA